MNKAILIGETLGDITEIDLDISPEKNEIYKLLKGKGTFIGQWPDIDVFIMKSKTLGLEINNNILQKPFDTEITHGPILLIRMDENSEPQDFTLEESTLCLLEQP